MASNFVVAASPCPSKLRGWLCSFAGCARCENQILSEREALKMGSDHKIVSVDQANQDFAIPSQTVLKSWAYIHEYLPMGLYHLKSLPRQLVLDSIHSSFPDMLSVGDLDEVQCCNYDIKAIRQHYGLQYRWLQTDMFSDSIQLMISILEERGSKHPSDLVSIDNRYLQLGWDLNLFKLFSADCCVSLKENAFGTTVATYIDDLHNDSVYTSTRGRLILDAQMRTYTGLAALVSKVLSLGRVLGNLDVHCDPTAAIATSNGHTSLVSSMHDVSLDLDRLSNSLKQAVLPADLPACYAIVSSITRSRPRYRRLGLNPEDATSSALSDLLWHKPITLLYLSQLQKDVKKFVASCPTDRAGNAVTASSQAAFHVVERDLETMTAVTARDLSSRYTGGNEAGIFGHEDQSVPDAIPLGVELHLLSQSRLAWLILHLSDSAWPLQDRIAQLVAHIDAGPECSHHFVDDISPRVSILRLIGRCSEVLKRMQPCSAIKSESAFASRCYGSVFQCLTAADTWIMTDQEQQELYYIWGACILARHEDRLQRVQALVARGIVYLERCWHERMPANLSLSDMWCALGVDSSWNHRLLDQGSLQLRALSELDVSRVNVSHPQRQTIATPGVATPDHDTEVGVRTGLNPPASPPATSPSKSENTAASVTPPVYRSGNRSSSPAIQTDSTAVTVIVMPKPKAPRPKSNPGAVEPFEPLVDSIQPRPVQARQSPQARSVDGIVSEGSPVGFAPSPSTTTRPSQFEEDRSQARNEPKKKTRPSLQPYVEDEEEEPNHPTTAIEDSQEKLVFRDPTLYDLWCEIFPPPGEGKRRGRELSFTDLRKVMKAPPLLFAEVNIEMPGVKFRRPRIGNAEARSFTLHLPHTRAPVFDKQLLDSLRVRLRQNFGWHSEDFVPEE